MFKVFCITYLTVRDNSYFNLTYVVSWFFVTIIGT
nr:MAG TPA: hypothetical protein [Caudoviricetes sp.]